MTPEERESRRQYWAGIELHLTAVLHGMMEGLSQQPFALTEIRVLVDKAGNVIHCYPTTDTMMRPAGSQPSHRAD